MSTTVTILGQKWPVSPPSGPNGFTAAEEWMEEVNTNREDSGLRIMGAAIGLTTSVMSDSGITLEKSGYKILRYGGEVYGYLRQKGASANELLAAAPHCYKALTSLTTPSKKEVEEKQDFTSGGEKPT